MPLSRSPHRPVLVFNLKAYAESQGKAGWRLARAADGVARSVKGVEVFVCPHASQLEAMAGALKYARVFSQAVDDVAPGAHTGSITVESIASSGCAGTLLNHAERKVDSSQAASIIQRARHAGLRVIACAASVHEARVLAKMRPWAVAFEIPQLIGSGVSVSTAEPDAVSHAVHAIASVSQDVRILVGAGVSTAGDVSASMSLGAQGVLVASAFVKSREPGVLAKAMAKAALQK